MGVEILSPVGSFDTLYSAVYLGADAVYLGAEKFNARNGAKNFGWEELIEAVDFCHVRGVKVYLTLNTLIKDKEISSVLSLVKFACSIPVDALIIQDIGLINLIRSFAPEMRIHASTQMSVHTPSGAKLLYEQGFSRVVLARELSREQILEISKECPIELEVFVHGALCMSVSGQCYLSAMLGGRSGNRGRCAQPCRLPFSVCEEGRHDLSLKDLSLIDYIPDLKKIGVTSVKIEGRMKRPEYVAIATRACKLAKEGKPIDEILRRQLLSVFSRSGFTNGYYVGKLGREMFGFRSKEDVVAATGKVLSEIRDTYKKEKPRVPVFFDLVLKRNQKLSLTVEDKDGNRCFVEGLIPEESCAVVLDEEKCCRQLKKTGNTPFFCENINCRIDEGIIVPMSALNFARRQVLTKLEGVRKKRKKTIFIESPIPDFEEHKTGGLCVRASFPNTNIPKAFKDCELIYVPLFSSLEQLLLLKEKGFNLAVEIPRGMFGKEKEFAELLKKVKSVGIDHALASNLGAVKLARDCGFVVHGGAGLNVTNSFALDWLEQLGLQDIEVSFELMTKEINSLKGQIKRGIIAYGRLPLMLLKNCPVASYAEKCNHCKKTKFVRDRKGVKFPLFCQNGCVELLNSVPVDVRDRINNFKNIDFAVLRFTVENSVENGENFLSFNNTDIQKRGFTRGLYSKGVD